MGSEWKRTLAKSQHEQLRNGRPKRAQNVTGETGWMRERESYRRESDVLRIVDSYIGCGGSSRLRTEHCPLDVMAKQHFVLFAGGYWRP